MKNKLWIFLILLGVLSLFSIGVITDAQENTSIEMPEQVPLTEKSANAKQIYTDLMYAVYLQEFNQDLSAARRIYDRLVQQTPDSAFVWYKRGQLRKTMQDIRGAELDTEKALELNPSHIPATWQLAQILFERASNTARKKNRDELVTELFTALKKVTELDPDHLNAHNLLADLSFRLNEYSTAEKSYKALTRILPFEPVFHKRLGDIYVELKQPEEAIDAYQRVIRIKSDDVEALTALGDLYNDLQRSEEAIDAYQRIIKIQPNDQITLKALGNLYLTTGKLRDAQEAFKNALILVPQDIGANFGMGLALEELAQNAIRSGNGNPLDESSELPELIQAAETHLKRVIFSAKEFIENNENQSQRVNYQELLNSAQYALAKVYVLDEKLDEAEVAFTQLLADDPDHIGANFGIASVYQTQGEFKQAETYLLKTLSLQRTHVYALNALGYLYAEQGTRLDEAEALIQRALKKYPKNGMFLDSLGWVFLKQGRIAESVTTLESANQNMPDNVEILMHLGDAYIQSGETEKARRVWQQAQTIAPDNDEIQKRLKQ